MRKKIIILIISIIVPIIACIVVGLYDYKIWYNPTGKNAVTYRGDYQSYVTSALLKIDSNTEYEQQTKDRINLYRRLSSYYYSEDPIYSKEVEIDGIKLFKIDIYEDIVPYTPDSESEYERSGYEVYIYNINYDELRELFRRNGKPDASAVDDNIDPFFVINFYPDEEYDDDASLFSTFNSQPGHEFIMYNDKTKVIGTALNSSPSYTLYDYNSTPTLKDDNPYFVKYLKFNDYNRVNIDDTGSVLDNTSRERFKDGSIIKIETIYTLEGSSYLYKNSLLEERIEELDFTIETLKKDDLKKGYQNDIMNLDIKGIKSYNAWIFSRFVWWQLLITFVAVGLVMVGFYFTFTFEEPNAKKKFKKKK